MTDITQNWNSAIQPIADRLKVSCQEIETRFEPLVGKPSDSALAHLKDSSRLLDLQIVHALDGLAGYLDLVSVVDKLRPLPSNLEDAFSSEENFENTDAGDISRHQKSTYNFGESADEKRFSVLRAKTKSASDLAWSTLLEITPFTLRTNHLLVELVRQCETGSIAQVFLGNILSENIDGKGLMDPQKIMLHGTKPCALKIVRNSWDRDLLEHEARVLQYLWTQPNIDTMGKLLPTYVKSIMVDTQSGKQFANLLSYHKDILPHAKGYVSLEEVLRAYPRGLCEKDVVWGEKSMVWMLKRLLTVLAFAHKAGVVHGAVVPANVLIHPRSHGGILIDWCASVQGAGGHISILDTSFREYYPEEVLKREKALPQTDIYMAASCAIALLGGDVKTGFVPDTVSKTLQDLLRLCRKPKVEDRYNDAWKVHTDLDFLLRRIYGPPHYTKFTMPGMEYSEENKEI